MSSYPHEESYMQPHILNAMTQAGIAGFFWGAVLYELLSKHWGRAGLALFCACAISVAAYLTARSL
jgi:hypothetical protein